MTARMTTLKSASQIPGAVRWHEGMLLAPQHMQQQAARNEQLLNYYAAAHAPFGWGVRRLDIDKAELENDRFRVKYVEAIMPDGLLVAGAPEDVDLGRFKADAAGGIKVYLCVPEDQTESAQATGRYEVFVDRAVRDADPEADEGQLALRIDRLRPSLSLQVGNSHTRGFVVLPIAELDYVQTAFQMTPYVPPLLAVEGEPFAHSLQKACDDLVEKTHSKARFLMDAIDDPIDSANRLFQERRLHSLMAGLPSFEALLKSQAAHPFALYVALSSLAGHVAALQPSYTLISPPRYLHDELIKTFSGLISKVTGILDDAVQEQYEEHRVHGGGDEHRFKVRFEPEWVGRPLVLAFAGQPSHEILEWAQDCYIGTESHIDAMSNHRDLGAEKIRKDHHEGLSRPPGTYLFALTADERYITAGETLHIFNPVKGSMDPLPSKVSLFVRKVGE